MQSWRNLDGSYQLRSHRFPTPRELHEAATQRRHLLPGWPRDQVERNREQAQATRQYLNDLGARFDEAVGTYVVPESAVDQLGAQRLFVVIVGGACCEPPHRREVRAADVARGRLFRVFCPRCGKRPSDGSTLWEVPIVEVCGEGEEGQQVYDAVFRAEVEGA